MHPDATVPRPRVLSRQFLSLLAALVTRDFKGRYRRSLLGPAWAILQPLAYMLIFMFLQGVMKLSGDGSPYPLFYFSALVPWTFLTNALTRSTPSLLKERGVIRKMALPREVFPVSAVGVSLLDLVMAGVVLGGMLAWYRVTPSAAWLWLPVLVAILVALAVGLSLLLASLGAYRSDVGYAIPFLMQAWLFLTPIMYPLSEVSDRWRGLYGLNPMAGVVEGFRAVLLHAQAPDLGLLGVSAAIAVAINVVAWPLFRSLTQYVADVM